MLVTLASAVTDDIDSHCIDVIAMDKVNVAGIVTSDRSSCRVLEI